MSNKKDSLKITKKNKKSLKKEDIEILPQQSPKILEQSHYEDNLPIAATTHDLVVYKDVFAGDALTRYLKEISKYELLSPEKEQILTKALAETGDIDIAKKLVLANLRLVVKIAMEYRSAWQNIMDLIQEGNLGLMKAVSKYDPTKGAKLSYYASWWIKSYILKYILDNFRLVKIGTTNEQKKLFYNLMKEKDRLIGMGIDPTTEVISKNLGVSSKAVDQMEQRLHGPKGEISLDKTIDNEGKQRFLDVLPSDQAPLEEQVADEQEMDIMRQNLVGFMNTLKERDLEIFKKRLLSEIPPSLQELADQYGVSRERIRQIEERLIGQLKVYMSEYIR